MLRFASVAALVLALSIVFPANAARVSKTLVNIPPTVHGAEQGTSLEEIRKRIEAAAAELHWRVTGRRDGQITFTLVIRRHNAIVDVGYDEKRFSITYRDSRNLNYDEKDRVRFQGKRKIKIKGPRIHPNYNLWVDTLAQRIKSRVAYPLTPPPDPVVKPRPQPEADQSISIADELEKLDRLRSRGVLTDEEFEARKRKILER